MCVNCMMIKICIVFVILEFLDVSYINKLCFYNINTNVCYAYEAKAKPPIPAEMRRILKFGAYI